MRHVYQQRRKLLIETLRADFSRWLEPIPSPYGMHLGAYARSGLDLERVTADLLRHQIKLHTFARYYLGPATRAGLVLGYGTAATAGLRAGLARLREALPS